MSTPNKLTPLLKSLLVDLKATTGVHEDPGRPNRGNEVDVYCRFLGLIGVAWCACYVAFKIHKIAKTLLLDNPWPTVSGAASCGWLANWLKSKGRLTTHPLQEVFVFLIPKRGGGFQHTGFGFNLRWEVDENVWKFETNEGNSNSNGSAEGYEVAGNTRTIKPGMLFGTIDPDGKAFV